MEHLETIATGIPGLLLFRPRAYGDARGYFMETYSAARYAAAGAPATFVQDNESLSRRGVIRGLHFQAPPYAQAKLVRCARGAVLDVAVDLRRGSPTYGRHAIVELSQENRLQLYLPRGFAHGFAVVSDEALFQYKCDAPYAPQAEGGIDLFDPDLAIPWPFDPAHALLSEKDTRWGAFRHFQSPFTYEG